MLSITASAIKEIQRIQQSRQQPSHPSFLQLKVLSGGCSGLYYQLELKEIDEEKKNTAQPGDRIVDIEGIRIMTDAESWQYIEKLKIDYAEDLMGGGFRFHNPQAKQVCGCGISFTVTD